MTLCVSVIKCLFLTTQYHAVAIDHFSAKVIATTIESSFTCVIHSKALSFLLQFATVLLSAYEKCRSKNDAVCRYGAEAEFSGYFITVEEAELLI